MAENQSEHRREMEKRELEIDARGSLLGLIFAFVFATVTICGSFFLICNRYEIAELILGTLILASVITAFRQNQKQDKKKEIE